MCWILHTMLTQCFGASCLQVNERGRPFLNILRTQWNGIPDGWSPLLSLTTWWFPEIRLHVIIHLSGISYQKPSIVFGTPMASWSNGRSRPHRHPPPAPHRHRQRRQHRQHPVLRRAGAAWTLLGAAWLVGFLRPSGEHTKKTWKITLFDG